jgi:hypothetical protein
MVLALWTKWQQHACTLLHFQQHACTWLHFQQPLLPALYSTCIGADTAFNQLGTYVILFFLKFYYAQLLKLCTAAQQPLLTRL